MTRSRSRPGGASLFAFLELLFDGLVVGLAVVLLVRLTGFVDGARLTSDECFHAWMSRWIASHGSLPAEVPGLYGGFKYFYPPLFHLLGAMFVAAGGREAFAFVNVACLAALFAVVAIGVARVSSRAAARLALLVLLVFGGLAIQGVRLYVEALTALLWVASVLSWLALWRSPSRGQWIVSGIAVGLGLLAKQTGLLALAASALIGGAAFLRGDRERARAFGASSLLALIVASPFYVRNAVLFGSPVYPVFGRDLHLELLRLNVIGYTPGPAKFYAQLASEAGLWLWLAAAAALLIAAFRRRTLAQALTAGCACALAAAPLVPMLDARHAVPLVAALVVLSAIVLAAEFAHRRAWFAGLSLLLALFAALAVFRLPNLRRPLDPPREYAGIWNAVRKRVPERATLLCLETYDAFYYTGRNATWPIPWGQKDPPFELFNASDPAVILRELRRHGIDFVLLPNHPSGWVFNTANYPVGFWEGMAELARAGEVEARPAGRFMGLLRVKTEREARR